MVPVPVEGPQVAYIFCRSLQIAFDGTDFAATESGGTRAVRSTASLGAHVLHVPQPPEPQPPPFSSVTRPSLVTG